MRWCLPQRVYALSILSNGFSFITGYWIWNKILENLATLGYDPYVSSIKQAEGHCSYYKEGMRSQLLTTGVSLVRISKSVIVILHYSSYILKR